MLNDTWPQYIFIRCSIWALQYIAPACLVYTGWKITQSWSESAFTSWWQIWPAAESMWFIFFLWYRRHLQREAIHPPRRSPEDRRALFDKVRSEIHDPQKFLSGWFRGAEVEDIGREELKLFLAWAFWDGKIGEKDEGDLEEYTQKVERMMYMEFRPGYGTARSLRLTLDPIEMECRSIFWYSLIGLVDFMTFMLMRRRFQYFRTTATTLQVLPIRPATWLAQKRSPVKNLSYWYRPHTSKKRLPVLFIHGIGVGLLPNVAFLRELDDALNYSPDSPDDDGEVGILALEVLQVSSRITGPIANRAVFLEQIEEILRSVGFDRFVLASHSYGSVLSTHILTHDPLASRIAATLLIDPVTLLLHMPDVAYNFTVRPPKHANEWQLWYFASKDPGVAHTLGRHFFWSENVLWRDRVMALNRQGMRITASLASRDLIVDTAAVGEYLMADLIPDPVVKKEKGRKSMELDSSDARVVRDWRTRKWTGNGVEVIWWDDFDHAQVFDERKTRDELVKVLVKYCADK